MGDRLRRYQPFVVVLVAVVLMALGTPGSGGDGGATAVAGDAGPTVPDSAALDSGAPGATVGGVDAGLPDVGGETTAVGSGGGNVATVAGPAPSATSAGGSGMGTPEALANPLCDRGRGRIRFPSPFAPVCVRPWPGGADNGGATARGVTADKITVGVLVPDSAQQSAEDTEAQIRLSLDIFEKHYELWGRKLDLRFHVLSGADEVAQRADAITMFNDHKPFIAFHGGQGPYPTWAAEMAARGVIVVSMADSWKAMQSQPGLRWSGASMDERVLWSHVAEYVGKRLVGRPAKWAGDEAAKIKPRVLGLVYPDAWDKANMDAESQRRGITFAEQVEYPHGDLVAMQERSATIVSKLKAKGVTTVVAATDIFATAQLSQEATRQLWFPEWITTGWGNQDTDIASRLADQRQWAHAFGPGPVQPILADAHYDALTMHQWHHGRLPDNTAVHGQTRNISHVLMTGLHVTGPTLTPASFAAALGASPPTGGSSCGCLTTVQVSFGRHAGFPWFDYSSFDDMTEKWWDPNTTGKDEVGLTAPGIYMKVDGGRRYRAGQWPSSDPKVFDRAGAAHRYDTPPKGEEIPQYPHQPHA